MVKYYYEKYTSIPIYQYSDTSPFSYNGEENVNYKNLYKRYSFDKNTNTYSHSDPFNGGESMGVGGTGFFAWGSRLERYQSKWDVSSVEASILATKSTKDALDNQKSVIGYNRDTLIESAIIAEDGTYPVNGRHSDGYWYVKGAKVNTAPNQTQIPTQNVKVNELITLNLANFFNDIEGDVITYTTASSNNAIATSAVSGNILTLSGKAIGSVAITVTASDGKLSTTQSFTLNVINTAPTVTLTSPINNLTLYENDVMSIAGNAYDSDKDQSVTVFYQINGEQRKVLATNVSQKQITLSKQLLFKDSKLYDGETVLTGTLAEGVEHKIKVWAVDSENEQSAIIERTFYVIPNRAPVLSIDVVEPSGVVDTDIFKIKGSASDEDANSSIKVTRRINNENPVEIYSGPGGTWEFDVLLSQLRVGENKIVIEVIDNYGAKASKTIKLKKNEVKTPILHAVARYKIKPPAGSAKGVLLFIERDEEMDLKVELSMTLAGEQEQYETLTADNTAPMPNTNGIVEDTYYHEAIEPKDNIILKLSTTRPDVTVNHKIHLVSGAVE